MHLNRKSVLVGAAGLAVVVLGVVALAMRGPIEPPATDLSNDLAAAYNAVDSGTVKLSPPNKVSVTVLAADGVPQRNAPSFLPRKISVLGAAPVEALQRRAVLVRYQGDSEGTFAVMSLNGKESDFAQDAGTIEFQNHRFSTFLRPGPGGAPLHGVGQVLGGRLVFVVGPQSFERLAELAVMIPPV